MEENGHSIHIDLTRAVQELGFGASDSEESDYEDFDWESIGLLPSWQKLQITLRNASYSFMTGLRKEPSKDSAEPETTGLTSGETIEAKDSLQETPLPVEANEILPKADAEDDEHSAKEVTELAKGQGDAKADPSVNSNEVGEEQGQGEEEEEEEEEDEDDEGDQEEDEWEEIGRLPSFNQLQVTLKNASEMFSLYPTIFGTSEASPQLKRTPSDLLSKWGGPKQGSLGWHDFMQNFQFPQLPAFLTEEVSDEEEPLDLEDPEVKELCSEQGLTAKDRMISYNEEGITGCPHYLRNCKTECSKCQRFYPCQICHDENEPSHQMDRRLTTRMLCLNCQRAQPPRRKCFFCKEVMGDYYCVECKLWNDDPDKPIYHCDKCGICRVGRGIGIDVFHCDTCGICMNLSVQNSHKCIEQAARSNCPICLDDLFLSSDPTVFMPCGHPIHKNCFTEYSKRYYRCPICAKSILNTSALFRMIDEEVQCEVLPPELANKLVKIICQDCRLKSRTKFHLAGLKCETCGSYNTSQL